MRTQQLPLPGPGLESVGTQHSRALRIKLNSRELRNYVSFKKRAAEFRVFGGSEGFLKGVKAMPSIQSAEDGTWLENCIEQSAVEPAATEHRNAQILTVHSIWVSIHHDAGGDENS